MIDLRELVMKASKKGVSLGVSFEKDGKLNIRAERLGVGVVQSIDLRSVGAYSLGQEALASRFLDELIYHLDKAEEKILETGGL